MSQQPPRPLRPRPARPLYQWRVPAFADWLAAAKPGEERVYHTGLSLAQEEGKLALVAIAHDALEAYRAGLVALVQRRTPTGFEYIAQRTRPDLRAA